jgi:hypothetical protein
MRHVEATCFVDEEDNREYMYISFVPLWVFYGASQVQTAEYNYERTLFNGEKRWIWFGAGTRYFP